MVVSFQCTLRPVSVWLVAVLAAALAAALGACSAGPDYDRYDGATMGTHYRVTAACPTTVGAMIEAELVAVNDEMSTYLPDSALSRFNKGPMDEWIPMPGFVIEVITAARALSEASGGAFDVTVGPLVNLWGFGPESVSGVPDADAIAGARARIGFTALETRAEPPALRKTLPLYVDLSAIAKGHGVDRVVARLLDVDCTDLLVDIGGEVRAVGLNPQGQRWRIGVEVPDPEQVGGIQRIVELDAAALATSGDYRNFIEAEGRRYSHTIDPRTGAPVEHTLASVTVLHPSAMWADGYATLLNVLGPEAGWEFAVDADLAALFVVRTDNGFEERYTAGFAAALPR
jgi:thiamine biosynthesis lipoprotein